MNLLSARRLHSYLLPTEHLNPHLGDPLMNHVSYTQRAENVKWKRGVASHPFLFSSTWFCPPSPPLLSHCTLVYWLEIEALTAPGLQS